MMRQGKNNMSQCGKYDSYSNSVYETWETVLFEQAWLKSSISHSNPQTEAWDGGETAVGKDEEAINRTNQSHTIGSINIDHLQIF